MKIININIIFLLNIFFLYIVDFIFLCTGKQIFLYIYEKVNNHLFFQASFSFFSA